MMGGFGMGGAGILLVILLGVAVWAIVSAANKAGTRSTGGAARETLDARLAQGELSVEEYKKLREAFGS